MDYPHIVTLVKKDGTIQKNIAADVQSKTIFIKGASVPVEIGDSIERTRANGIVDNFKVTNVAIYDKTGYYEGHIELAFVAN
jgi:hypothetical protein